VGLASLLLAGCGGALSGGGTGGTGIASGTGGSRVTGLGNFGGSTVGTGGLGGGPAGMNCGSVDTPPATPILSDVLIVLDASAAMNDDATDTPCSGGCGASSKWAQTVAAIEKLVGDTELTVNWGLQIFPDPGTACGVAGSVAVPVGPARATAIAAAIGARTSANGGVIAGGDAPIRDAVRGATDHLSRLTEVGPKLILLATAGEPSCPVGGSDAGAGDATGAVQAIVDARNAGVPTTVLGIAAAGGMAAMTLDAMAVEGGVPRTGSPRYTPVANIGELTSGSHTLIAVKPPCILAVPQPPSDATSRSRIRVRVDDTEIPRDPNHLNGWDFFDPSQSAVELYGPACETLMSGPHTVTIAFICGPIP